MHKSQIFGYIFADSLASANVDAERRGRNEKVAFTFSGIFSLF